MLTSHTASNTDIRNEQWEDKSDHKFSIKLSFSTITLCKMAFMPSCTFPVCSVEQFLPCQDCDKNILASHVSFFYVDRLRRNCNTSMTFNAIIFMKFNSPPVGGQFDLVYFLHQHCFSKGWVRGRWIGDTRRVTAHDGGCCALAVE